MQNHLFHVLCQLWNLRNTYFITIPRRLQPPNCRDSARKFAANMSRHQNEGRKEGKALCLPSGRNISSSPKYRWVFQAVTKFPLNHSGYGYGASRSFDQTSRHVRVLQVYNVPLSSLSPISQSIYTFCLSIVPSLQAVFVTF